MLRNSGNGTMESSFARSNPPAPSFRIFFRSLILACTLFFLVLTFLPCFIWSFLRPCVEGGYPRPPVVISANDTWPCAADVVRTGGTSGHSRALPMTRSGSPASRARRKQATFRSWRTRCAGQSLLRGGVLVRPFDSVAGVTPRGLCTSLHKR